MNNDTIQVEFKGFDPGYDIKNIIAAVAENLHLSAPSDAAMKVAIQKSQHAVLASCRIASQAGVFVADAMSDCPVQAFRKIEKKIKRQLDGWKRKRFSEVSQPTLSAG